MTSDNALTFEWLAMTGVSLNSIASRVQPVVLSLGLGLSVLAAVGQIDGNLRTAIDRDLPEIAPAYFFVDIQNTQLDGFLDEAKTVDGVGEIATAPMLRGVITALNGVSAAEAKEQIDPGARWAPRPSIGICGSPNWAPCCRMWRWSRPATRNSTCWPSR